MTNQVLTENIVLINESNLEFYQQISSEFANSYLNIVRHYSLSQNLLITNMECKVCVYMIPPMSQSLTKFLRTLERVRLSENDLNTS